MNRSALRSAGLFTATRRQPGPTLPDGGTLPEEEVAHGVTPVIMARSPGGGGNWSGESNRGGWTSRGGGNRSGSGYRGSSPSGGEGSWSGRTESGDTASGAEGSWHGIGTVAGDGAASGGEGAWHAQGEYGAEASGYHANGYATTAYRPPVYGASTYHPVP